MLLAEIKQLSDKDLFAKLRSFDVDVGPIVETTRSVYQRKLQRCIDGITFDYNAGGDFENIEEEEDDSMQSQFSEPERAATDSFHQQSNPSMVSDKYSVPSNTQIYKQYDVLPATCVQVSQETRESRRKEVDELLRRRHESHGVSAPYTYSISGRPSYQRSTGNAVRPPPASQGMGISPLLKVLGILVLLVIVYLIYINIEPSVELGIPSIPEKQ